MSAFPGCERLRRNRVAAAVVTVAVVFLACGHNGSLFLVPEASTTPESTAVPESTAAPEATAGPEPTSVAAPSAGLNVPPGWHVAPDGAAAAADPADLTSEIPSGPRVQAMITPTHPEAAIEQAAATTVTIRQEPAQVTVGGQPGVSIVLSETTPTGTVVRCYLYAYDPEGRPLAFILEAPPDQWDQSWDTLKTVIGLAD